MADITRIIAGPIPQTAVQFWNNVSVSAGATKTYELNAGQCYGVDIIVNTDLDPSASDGGTLKIYKKTGSAGTKCNTESFAKALDDDPDGAAFTLSPGTWSIEVTNDDGTYPLTLNGWYRLLT